MFEDIVGKDVEVIVSFSGNRVDAGSVPITYYGTLLESTAERSVLNITSNSGPFANKRLIKKQGKVFLNNNYIVSIMIAS